MTNRAEVYLLPGMDCDRPRLQYLANADARAEAQQVVDYLRRLTDLWSEESVSWTMFFCGSFLEALAALDELDTLRDVVESHQMQGEVACHTYSHRPIAPVPGRTDVHVLSTAELVADLTANEGTLRDSFATRDNSSGLGFRAPYGAGADGLAAQTIDVLSERRTYSSSLLRGSQVPLAPALVENGRLRQPFRYPSGLWEIPSHGFHDTFFANISGTQTLGHVGSEEAFAHYSSLVDQAIEFAEHGRQPIYIGLSLHPIAMSTYDPEMTLLARLLDRRTSRVPVHVASYEGAVAMLSGGDSS